MASNRHLGRIIVLQSLYEHEFRVKAGDATADLTTIIAKNIQPYEKALGDTEFVYHLAQGVDENIKKLDDELRPLAPEWPIDTIAAIDRNVLRIGLYELEVREVPPKVVLNEAVELAKAFGSDNSSKFVNGVLGTAYRELGLDEEEEKTDGENGKAAKKSGKKPEKPAQKSAKGPEKGAEKAPEDGAKKEGNSEDTADPNEGAASSDTEAEVQPAETAQKD